MTDYFNTQQGIANHKRLATQQKHHMKKRNILIAAEIALIIIGLAASLGFFLAWRSVPPIQTPVSDEPLYGRSERAFISFNDGMTPGAFYEIDLNGPYMTVQSQHFSSTLEGIKNPPPRVTNKAILSADLLDKVWNILNYIDANFSFPHHPDYAFYYDVEWLHACDLETEPWEVCYRKGVYIHLLTSDLEAYGDGKRNEIETLQELNELMDIIVEEVTSSNE